MNQTLSHDNSQLYGAALDTSCIHMAKINTGLRERDSQKQQSPEIKINKALRLVKQVLLLAAGRALCVCMCLCVCVCACVCQASAGHISAVGESAGRERSYFCLKHIHRTTAEAEPMSPWSPCAPSQNDLSCVSVCLSLLVYLCVRQREGVCV